MIFTKIARLFSVFSLVAFYAVAQSDVKTASVIDADDIEYAQEQDLVIAKGNVEIFKNNYLLRADKVIYDKAHHKVYAIGNVYVLDPNGNEVSAGDLEIDQDLKEAIIENFNIRMADNALFTANKGNYYHPDRMMLEKAVYSSCPVCEGGKAPQWQFAANKVNIDQTNEKVVYKHAFFEIFGKPILYTPYFSHPTPHAKSKSGFLTPGQKYSTIYGSGIQIPYYLRISEDKDLLFSPILTSRQGILYIAKYKQLTRSGFYTIYGSYNSPRVKTSVKLDNRYYANINGQTKINDDWGFNSNLQYTSDKSYLRNYFDDNQNYLTSQMDFIYNKNRDYAVVNSLYFQELRPTIEQRKVPIILPVVDYHKEFVGSNNNRYVMDSNLLLLSRKEGSETKRFSTTGLWSKTYFTKTGQQISVYRRIRGDGYNFTRKKDAFLQNNQNNNGSNNVARLIPEAEVQWQYPLINTTNNADIFIEPVANVILSPNMPVVSNVINEDSQEVEISDDNLFSSNRYAGYDRVENGFRGAYGLNGYYRGSKDIIYSFVFGQSYRVRKDVNYSIDSGLRRNLSDVVGRMSVKPWKPVDIYYRFRIDPVDKIIRRNEVRADFTYNPYRFSVGFVAYNYLSHASESSSTRIIRSADLGGWYNITPEWIVGATATQNYTASKKFLVASGASIGYNGACTTLLFSMKKDYTKDPLRNFKPTTTFSFDFHLKGIDK
jgi:LPS-assembly protein